ncbi:unnamed protein product [Miscanthus lutarioriparius]|uniref:Uncharacterized protein n=1 Tax=Miscanthus lutarioriparius TaxID=422564 RepID=A0A811MHY1_9POAL|nr:unnamed protein product [Miscanthus lutarioriparius]
MAVAAASCSSGMTAAASHILGTTALPRISDRGGNLNSHRHWGGCDGTAGEKAGQVIDDAPRTRSFSSAILRRGDVGYVEPPGAEHATREHVAQDLEPLPGWSTDAQFLMPQPHYFAISSFCCHTKNKMQML